jgi:TetR/AcrR family transcriptional regulator, transcriptional repressor for nem operon
MNAPNPTPASDVRSHILATGQRIMAGKGYSAVDLNEILPTAGVPKGSFCHDFSSKDAYGKAMLERYFEDYLAELDGTLRQPGLTAAQRLMNYWQSWQVSQSFEQCQGKCLAVKLGAEVADLRTPAGRPLVEGRQVTGFTNSEEAAVGLTDVVPFLVEDELKAWGGVFSRGADWGPYVVRDGLLMGS